MRTISSALISAPRKTSNKFSHACTACASQPSLRFPSSATPVSPEVNSNRAPGGLPPHGRIWPPVRRRCRQSGVCSWQFLETIKQFFDFSKIHAVQRGGQIVSNNFYAYILSQRPNFRQWRPPSPCNAASIDEVTNHNRN